ncbi:MAG TPA: YoaK family protein [Candidatus Sulfotelmatobacter sp.]|nr:YoaK family protein [Candidatus Sulfotelmatobacter sp.]
MPGLAQIRRTDSVAVILLTLTAGYVDAVGFLKLGGIYVANMSGNSVSTGIHSVEGEWSVVLFRLWAIGCFVSALFLTRLLIDSAAPVLSGRVAAPALVVEIVLLVFFSKVKSENAGIFCAAVAMGVHTATLNRFNGITVYTTFVTGTLVKFAEHLAEWVLRLIKREDPATNFEGARWLLSVWAAYITGAGFGAGVFRQIGSAATLLACAGVAVVILIDLVRPLSAGV